MRKFFLAVAAMAMLATACTKDDAVSGGNESLVSFTIDSPELATRYGDGTTATNLEWAFYDETGTKLDAISSSIDNFTGTYTLTVALVDGRQYTALFWASAPDAPYTVDWAGKKMTIDNTNLTANNEAYDAFYNYSPIDPAKKTHKIELTRPFAQVNIATADTAAATAAGVTVATTQVAVVQSYKTLNFVDGTVSDKADFTYKWAAKATGTATVGGKDYDMLSMNYVLVNNRELVNVSLRMSEDAAQTTDNDATDIVRNYTTVPVQRNYRTYIVGNLLTTTNEFNVTTVPGFEDITLPETAEEKLRLAAQTGGEYTLEADLELTSALNVTGTLTINMGNHKLTGSINVAENANLTINNGTIENTDDNTSGIVSNGTLTLNNVEVISARHALRIESGKAVINGGTYKVAPISSKTLNALNVGDDNTVAEVLIKGGTFIGPKGTMADSGAAVSVKTGSKVTVEGGDFSGGKNNTLSCKGEISITGGTFDQNPSAWVAEGYKAIESDGKYFVVTEGYDAFIVVTPENIDSTTFDADNALYWFEGAFNNVDFTTAAGKTQAYDASAATFNGRIKIKVARTADGYVDVESERSGNYKLVGFATENSLCVAANAVESLVIEDCTAYMAYLNITNTSTTLQGNTFVRPATAEDEYQRFDNGRYQEDIIQVYAENYDLQLVGNTIKNEKVVAKCNCIAIVGEYEQYQQGHNPQWTNSVTMTGNTISDVSNTEALVKIWNDVTFAPVAWPADYEITAAALALAKQLKVENTVNGGSCILDILCRRATGPDANIKLNGTDEDKYPNGYYKDAEGVFHVVNGNGLLAVFTALNTATETTSIVLDKDVDLQGIEWPVINPKAEFELDGKDKTIANLTADEVTGAAGFNSTGFICVNSKPMTIKNVVFDRATITNAGGDNSHSAVVVASPQGEVTLEKVTVTNSTVSNADRSSILVAYLAGNSGENGYATDCVVSGCTINGIGTCGAILGHNNTHYFNATRCQVNTSTMTSSEGPNKAGIIVGTNNDFMVTLTDCTHTGSKAINAGVETNNEVGRDV